MKSRITTARFPSKGLGLFFVSLAFAMQLAPLVARAGASSDLTITPVIIDEKAKAQDILNESVSITNTSDHKMMLYPSVNDVNTAIGEQTFQAALNAPQAAGSLSNWIELSRGVISLDPGEEKTVPFVIQVPRDAAVGSYHALVSFSNGSTRDQAAAQGSLGDVTVNVDLQADIKELMQLSSFTTDNVVFTGNDALFKYQLQNVGNQPLDPKGEIVIYNRNGEEVASVNVNNEGKIISPDQVSQLASVWSAANGFGKYKAVINVDYGTNQVASVQDVTYFWVIPWKQVLGLSIIVLIGLILFALYFERWFQDWHFSKFAAEGLIKTEIAMQYVPGAIPERVPQSPRASAATGSGGGERSGFFGSVQHRKKPVPEFKSKTPAPGSLHERLQVPPLSAPTKPATTGTVDLKQMMSLKNERRVGEQHVINLKR